MPDHGEVWSESWELDRDALAEHRIRTRLRLPISPLWIERDITLTGQTVQFDYRLRNLSDEPFEYLWAFHPMLHQAPGDHLVMPETCRSVRTEVCLGGHFLGHRGDWWAWPEPETSKGDFFMSIINTGMRARKVRGKIVSRGSVTSKMELIMKLPETKKMLIAASSRTGS